MNDLHVSQDAVSALLGSFGPADWARPTPCPEWDVAGVVRHLIVGDRAFTVSLGGSPYDLAALREELVAVVDDDLPAAYAESAAALRAAFGGPGPFPTGLGPMTAEQIAELRTLEALVHGWDVGPLAVEPAVAERAIGAMHALIARLPPDRTPFGPPQPVADDAPALDRLVALVGRPLSG